MTDVDLVASGPRLAFSGFLDLGNGSDNFNVWDESIENGIGSRTTAAVVALRDDYVVCRLVPGEKVYWGTGSRNSFTHYTPSFDEGIASNLEQTKRFPDYIDDTALGDSIVFTFSHDGRAHFVTGSSDSSTCTVLTFDPLWDTLGKWTFTLGASVRPDDVEWAFHDGLGYYDEPVPARVYYIQKEVDGSTVNLGQLEPPSTVELYDSEDDPVSVSVDSVQHTVEFAYSEYYQGDYVEDPDQRVFFDAPTWRFTSYYGPSWTPGWMRRCYRVWEYTGVWGEVFPPSLASVERHRVNNSDYLSEYTSGVYWHSYTHIRDWEIPGDPPEQAVAGTHNYMLGDLTTYYGFGDDHWKVWSLDSTEDSIRPVFTEWQVPYPFLPGSTVETGEVVPFTLPTGRSVEPGGTCDAIIGPVVKDLDGSLRLLALRGDDLTGYPDPSWPLSVIFPMFVQYDPEMVGKFVLRPLSFALDMPPLHHPLKASDTPNAQILAHIWHPPGYLAEDAAEPLMLEALVSLDAENPRDDEASVEHMASLFTSLGALVSGIDQNVDLDLSEASLLLSLDADLEVDFPLLFGDLVLSGVYEDIEDVAADVDLYLSGVVDAESLADDALVCDFDTVLSLDTVLLRVDEPLSLDFDTDLSMWALLYADYDLSGLDGDLSFDGAATLSSLQVFEDVELRGDLFLSLAASLSDESDYEFVTLEGDLVLSGAVALSHHVDLDLLTSDMLWDASVGTQSNYVLEPLWPVPTSLRFSGVTVLQSQGYSTGVPPTPGTCEAGTYTVTLPVGADPDTELVYLVDGSLVQVLYEDTVLDTFYVPGGDLDTFCVTVLTASGETPPGPLPTPIVTLATGGYELDAGEDQLDVFMRREGDFVGRVRRGPNLFISDGDEVDVSLFYQSPSGVQDKRVARLFGYVYDELLSFEDALLIVQAGYGKYLRLVS